MKTTIQEQNGNMVAVLEGRLDTAASPETERALSPLLESEGQDVILDCTRLEYISSSGLRIFLGILKSAQAKGGRVYITGISDNIRAIFAMTGFINLFQFK